MIVDIDGRKIELVELVNKYFSNPEEHFEKGYGQEEPSVAPLLPTEEVEEIN